MYNVVIMDAGELIGIHDNKEMKGEKMQFVLGNFGQ